MPEIRDYYTEVKDMDLPSLHTKRQEILDQAPFVTTPDGQMRDFSALGDDALAYLLAVTRQLRKHAAIGTKTKSGAPRKPKAPVTLDDLL